MIAQGGLRDVSILMSGRALAECSCEVRQHVNHDARPDAAGDLPEAGEHDPHRHGECHLKKPGRAETILMKLKVLKSEGDGGPDDRASRWRARPSPLDQLEEGPTVQQLFLHRTHQDKASEGEEPRGVADPMPSDQCRRRGGSQPDGKPNDPQRHQRPERGIPSNQTPAAHESS